MKKRVIQILVLIIFYGCSKNYNKNIIVNNFPKTITLNDSVLKEIQIYGTVRKLQIIDSFLIMQKTKEKFIQIYSTNSHKLLKEIGLKGRGPGEMLMPELVESKNFNVSNQNKVCKVYDFQRRRLYTINIMECLINDNSDCIIEEIIPNIDAFVKRLLFKNDTLLWAVPEGTTNRFVIYNYKTDELKKIPYIPEVNFRISENYIPSVYFSTCCVNFEKNIIVTAPLLLGEIDFFDLKGNYLKSTIFESQDELKKELDLRGREYTNEKTYIIQLSIFNNKIYCLNNNIGNRDMVLIRMKKKDKSTDTKILVFDWEGNPVVEYNLGRHYISSFAIDSLHNRIYAYYPYEEDENIVVFNLK